MLKREDTVFVLVDVQGKLARTVHKSEQLIQQLEKLIAGMNLLRVPTLWLEQYPKGLGETVPELTKHLEKNTPIEKITFSACKNDDFMNELERVKRKQIVIAGIETHVCVYQTAAELKALTYEVQVVEDAVSSRTLSNKQIGLEKMKSLGIKGTSVEMVLYELMEKAGTTEFKEILKIIK